MEYLSPLPYVKRHGYGHIEVLMTEEPGLHLLATPLYMSGYGYMRRARLERITDTNYSLDTTLQITDSLASVFGNYIIHDSFLDCTIYFGIRDSFLIVGL